MAEPAESRSCTTCKTEDKDPHKFPCRGCDLVGAPVNWEPKPSDSEAKQT